VPNFSGTIDDNTLTAIRRDRYIAERLKLLTRSQIKVRALSALVNGKPVKLSRLVRTGDQFDLAWNDIEPTILVPEDIPLDVIYEDEQVIVVNKPQGMVVHPGAGNRTGTLANALLFRHQGLFTGDVCRPGIVHRLDKDTSGVIIAAYTTEALTFLADQFRERQVRKRYAAIVQGTPQPAAGRIESRIIRDPHNRQKFTVSPDRGKNAVTDYRVIKSLGQYSLLLLKPKTGRTHQLRVHLRSLGHPILGDPLYGTPNPLHPLMLHAKSLTLILPDTTTAHTFTTHLPDRFRKYLPVSAVRQHS
jgi:23S rRNA pseudouridine1911/1915/1917 synthase